ncbi:hypothetical protein GCM10011507_27200 [Edaphobacter acidisoli]|uniref:histidine kinase n=1 Tax=Edaphobacter acidisoli TaxID=2040573 RepID=A0A916RWP2_9BACT|nr:PAS domain-containing protein [Edaphobacter acidisoli]GGA74358.1 hypothetical protein GCM10011507_27200 [Edaphobacter acidisoli]
MSNLPIDDTGMQLERRSKSRRDVDAERDHLLHLLMQLPGAIACLDRDWYFTFVNPEAMRLFRLTPELIRTRNHWEIFPEKLGTEVERVYRSVMETGRPAYIEYHCVPLDVWLDTHILPIEGGVALFCHDVTDRKGAEMLRDSAARRLNQVLEATTDAVVSINREGNFTFLNRRARELLAAKGDLLGKNVWQEFPAANHLGAYRYHFDRALTEGIASEFEEYYPEPLNLWLAIQLRPFDDGVVVFFRDMTARRQATATLTRQQELLSVVQQAARVATWDIDCATGKVTFGDGSYPVFGHPLESLPHFGAFKKIVVPEYLPVIAACTKAAIETGEVIVQEFQVRAADGSILWLESRGQAVMKNGFPISLRGITLDIHERKKSEEALRQRQAETERQRAELETIYQTAPIGLSLFDPVEFRYLRVNDRQAETIGLPREQILGRPITEIAPIDGLIDLFRQAVGGHPVKNHLLEGELATRPGERRFWNVSYSPVANSDGTVAALAAAVLEITNQKKAEAALVQSEKLAAVGRLASSISHEINNPLEAITNLLYLTSLDPGLPQHLQEYVHAAQSELSRVCQIATQTLRFHRQAVRATRVTAAELVDAVLKLYAGRLANSAITVDAKYASDTPILCFENDIRQVLNNLIANAIDAMRQGGRLVIRAHNAKHSRAGHTAGRDGIRITIADTGTGMSPAVRARIFEPFYTTKDLNGTGLGLWISEDIVKRHQGHLTFRTTEHPVHHGTVFSLFLPLEETL